MAKKNVWNDPDNPWARSKDPEKLRADYERVQRNKQLREMRTKNVIERSLIDRLRGKPEKYRGKR